jgi:hypothetical protein
MQRKVRATERRISSPIETVAALSNTRGVAWLDSSLRLGDWGRLSLLATEPVEELVWHEDGSDFFLRLVQATTDSGRVAVGYISYDAALPWVGVTSRQTSSPSPVRTSWCMTRCSGLSMRRMERSPFDRLRVTPGRQLRAIDKTRRHTLARPGPVLTPAATPQWTPNESGGLLALVERIKWHIHEGDI